MSPFSWACAHALGAVISLFSAVPATYHAMLFVSECLRRGFGARVLSDALRTLVVFVALPALSLGWHDAEASTASKMPDLGPDGWTRDAGMLDLKIDRYRTKTGTVTLDLLGFPPTNLSAKAWTTTFIQHMTKPDREAGFEVHVIDQDEIGSKTATGKMNTSEPGLDMATHSVMVMRPELHREHLLMTVRAMVRQGQSVQVSLRTVPGGKATPAELLAASRIAYDARIPVNDGASVKGLEAMVGRMTRELIYPDSSSEEAAASVERGVAPPLIHIPGPRVMLTGKWLSRLPAGYRMHIWATHYWVAADGLTTHHKELQLMLDGQFEAGPNSNLGSAESGALEGPMKVKRASSTNSLPGQPRGASSVFMKKREGIAPSRYGTYFIAGDEIEFLFASGKTVRYPFKTDGFGAVLLGAEKYFVSAPEGWEKLKKKHNELYRDIGGSSLITVSKVSQPVTDGVAWMAKCIDDGKQKGLIISAGPISQHVAGDYRVVKTSMVLTGKTGVPTQRDVYIRYSTADAVSRLIRVESFKGARDDEVLKFIEHLR